MSFPKSTTMRNPKIAPRLPMARCAGFHYRLLAAVETRIGPILKLDTKAVPDKLQGKGVSGRLLNWRHHPLRYVSREEETMGLTNLPEYISAIVAIIALLISCYQARLSNKQSLFNRRINIWITVDKLVSVYAKNAKNLEHNDEPQLTIDRLFVWLTNTTYLQSISASINHVLDADPQLKLHLKLDEMKSLAMEARFCFKGKSGDAIAEFIEDYQSLLFSMYQYQILLNKMSQSAKVYQWTLEQASEQLHEPEQRQDLFEKEDVLATSYKTLCQQNKRGSIQRQIQLAGPIWR